jgi:hypothetical protein
MGLAGRAGRAMAVLSIAAAVMTAAVSGCTGSNPAQHAVPARAAAGSPRPAVTPSARPVVAVAPPGSRGQAEQFGRGLLARAVLPPGAQRLYRDPAPSLLGLAGPDYGADPSVQMHRFYRLPVAASAAAAYIQAHLPSGTVSDGGTGSFGHWDVTQALIVSASAAPLPAGIYLAELAYTIAIEPDGSFVRVGVQVSWFVPRPAAEDFAADDYRSVTLYYQPVLMATGSAAAKTVFLTITSRPLLSTIVGKVNDLQTDSGDCMEGGAEGLWLRLNPLRPGQPAASVAVLECDEYAVQVGSAAEPKLWSSSNALPGLMARLLKVHPRV